MKFCPNCGNQIKAGEKFCGRCGFNLADYQQKAVSSNEVSGATQHKDIHPEKEEIGKVSAEPKKISYPKKSSDDQKDTVIKEEQPVSAQLSENDEPKHKETLVQHVEKREDLAQHESADKASWWNQQWVKYALIVYLVLGTIGIIFTGWSLYDHHSVNIFTVNVPNKLYAGTWKSKTDSGNLILKISKNGKKATITHPDTTNTDNYKVVWRNGLNGTNNRKLGYLVDASNNTYMTFEVIGGSESNADNAKIKVHYSNVNNVYHKE